MPFKMPKVFTSAIKTQTRSQCCGTTSRGEVEIEYLEQVEAAIAQMDKYQTLEDLEALQKSVRS